MSYFQASYIIATLAVSVAFQIWRSRLRPAAAADEPDLSEELTDAAKRLISILSTQLSNSVILPGDSAFKASIKAYWAQQECEVAPSCIVRPRDVHELCTAIRSLKNEYDERGAANVADVGNRGVFAIRSGGHSPVSGAASLRGGVVVDLSHLNEVAPSEDGKSVIIVVGGRNSDVGVGGLVLGGGLSFFSPRFGFVCNNIISYELVVANGEIITASATEHSDLWRALKGGSNNFGIVTRFTARSLPCEDIWSGFLYMTGGQHRKVLSAFFESLNQSGSSYSVLGYDCNAAGPLACFTYLQQINSRIISINLVHTNPPRKNRSWPKCWADSGFARIWRFWSDVEVRSLTSATDQMTSLNPPGRRQEFATTTIKNDLQTLCFVHDAYNDAIRTIRSVKGISWTLVLQPLLPSWARKGDPNPLGLNEGIEDPLVIVSFTINWAKAGDDSFVEEVTRKVIEQIDDDATVHVTIHRYRYLNYCGRWQKPFGGYGEENLKFLRDVSHKYDPDGLFQKGCVGGFKLHDSGSDF